MVHFNTRLVCSMIACGFTDMDCNARATLLFFPFSPPPFIDLFSLPLLCTVLFLFLTPPLCPPTQVVVWENGVLPVRFLWHVVWYLQPDHSNPARHRVLCESMLPNLW